MESTLKYLPPYEITAAIPSSLITGDHLLPPSSSIISLLNRWLDFNEAVYIAETLAVDDLNGKFIKQYIAVSNIYDTGSIKDYLFQVHTFLAAGGTYIGFAERKGKPIKRQFGVKPPLSIAAFPNTRKFQHLVAGLARNISGKLIRSKKNNSPATEIIDCLFNVGFNVADYTEENNIFMFIAKKYKHLNMSKNRL